MNKWFAIVMVSIYGFLTIGVHLHLHYCCDKLADISILLAPAEGCESSGHGECSMEKQCCTYKEMDFRIQDDQKVSSFFRIPALDVTGLTTRSESSSSFHENVFSCYSFEDILPPGRVPLYMMNCCLVLYA